MAHKTQQSNEYSDLLEFARNYKPIKFLPILSVYTEEDEAREFPEEKEAPIKVNPLDPKTLDEFVGQDRAKEVIKIVVDSANKEKRLIPNIILSGPYGHGKTTLAKLIIKRHRKKAQIIDGSLAGELVHPSRDKIYIIDEAHNIPTSVADSFNILIDSGNLRIIACTTNPGALPAPFRSRFRSIYLEDYQPKDIAKIIERASKRLSLKIDKLATNDIANRSKCNPRTALTTLDFVREVSVMHKQTEITSDIVLEALNKLDIDEIGLSNLDRKYLGLLKPTHPAGLQYLSAILSIDSETIQEEIEPYLLRLGLIERTPRGRIKVDTTNIQAEMSSEVLDQLKRSIEAL